MRQAATEEEEEEEGARRRGGIRNEIYFLVFGRRSHAAPLRLGDRRSLSGDERAIISLTLIRRARGISGESLLRLT